MTLINTINNCSNGMSLILVRDIKIDGNDIYF